jgi:TP901 family phage tail tape measure protein
MADVNATFNYDANFGSALSQIKALSKELSVLNNSFNSLDKNARVLRNDIANTFSSAVGQIGGFSSKTVTITSDLDNFGKSLDRSKLKLRDYYREATRAFSANSNARKLAEDQVRRTKGQLVELGMDAEGRRKGMLVTPMRLDMTDMNNQLQVARKQFDIFNRLIQDGATSLINWGKNTQWAGRQLTVGLTVPMTIFATTTIKAFNDVDRELTRFQKVYGADLVGSTKEASMEMRNVIQSVAIEIAGSYGIAAKETAALAADLAATGLEGKKLVDSLKQTTRLAVLGEIDRQDAMQTTLSLQNAFNMSTQELAESIDFLNAVENQTSVSLQDLTVAIPKVGPVIEALGGDVKDLSVLLVAMKEGGINAAEGANALKSGLASLINPTKAGSAVAKQYGIDLQGIVTRNKGQLMPTLLEFQSSLSTLDDFGKAKIIEQLFGKYQFARISALFDNLNASGSQTIEVMKLMGASSEELAKIADGEIKTLTESTSMRFQRSMEAIKASLLPIGEVITRSVIPFMEKFANFMEKVIEVGKGLPEPVKNFLKFAAGLTAIAGPAVMITGVLANFFGYVTKGAMAFVNLGRRLAGLPTKQFSLLDDQQIAAAKATDTLTVSIQNQSSAMTRLVQLMRDYNSTLIAQRSATPGAFTSTPLVSSPRRGGVPPRGTPIRRQQGSWVPGSGSGDKVKALLEPGEFVVNRNAAKQYGGVLEDINNGTPRFQNGGVLKMATAGSVPFRRVSGPGAFRQSAGLTGRRSMTPIPTGRSLTLDDLSARFGIDLSRVQSVDDLYRALGSLPKGTVILSRNKSSTKNPVGSLRNASRGLFNMGWSTKDQELEILKRMGIKELSYSSSHIQKSTVLLPNGTTAKIWTGDNLLPDYQAFNNALQINKIDSHPTTSTSALATIKQLESAIADPRASASAVKYGQAAIEILKTRISGDYYSSFVPTATSELSKISQMGVTSQVFKTQPAQKKQSGGVIHARFGMSIPRLKRNTPYSGQVAGSLTPNVSQRDRDLLDLYFDKPQVGHLDNLHKTPLGEIASRGMVPRQTLYRGMSDFDMNLVKQSGTLTRDSVMSTTRDRGAAIKIASGLSDSGGGNTYSVAKIKVGRKTRGVHLNSLVPRAAQSLDEILLSPQTPLHYRRSEVGYRINTGESIIPVMQHVFSTKKPNIIQRFYDRILKSRQSELRPLTREEVRYWKQEGAPLTEGMQLVANKGKTIYGDNYEENYQRAQSSRRVEEAAAAERARRASLTPEESRAEYLATQARIAERNRTSTGVQTGGIIRAQEGVFVPGSGDGDRVPALLEPGEFVVNKKAAKQHGGLLHDLNFNQAPRFQSGGMAGMKLGAVGGAMLSASFLAPMVGVGEGMQKLIMVIGTLTSVLSALQMIMVKNTAAQAASGVGGLLERGAAKRAGGKAAIRGAAPLAPASGLARAGQVAGGVGRLGMGALMSGPGIALVAAVALGAAAWMKYKKEVEEARKATEQAFSVGKKTAEAYGYELTKISDKLKENAELTKQIGINSSTVTSSIIVDEEKKAAILEDNAELIADLQEKQIKLSSVQAAQTQYTVTLPDAPTTREEAVQGDTVPSQNTREVAVQENTSVQISKANEQIKSQLLTKYATLRQKGVSVEDANEIIRVIAMESGDETISALLDLKPTLEKMNNDNLNEVFKAAQAAQLAGLKNIDTGSTGGGEAFREAITASMDIIQYAPPEDQLLALNNLINNMKTFNSDQIVLASEALATAAAENYGTKSGIGQALQTLFKSGDVDQITLGAEIDTLMKSNALTANQQLEIQLGIAVGDVDKVNSIIDPVLKDRNLKINMTVDMQRDAQDRIEEINKEITAQQAKFDGQMIANDNAVESENDRYENAQKAHEKFIKQKQDEIEAINKSADAYIKALQDEQRADDFAQQQRDTATGGLKALASGDVFGFVQSQQEMAGAAQEFGFESEIKAIDERRQAAVDAKQEEIKAQQELAATEDERHQNNLKALEAQRVAHIKANGDIMKGFQGQQAALEQISGSSGAAYDGIVAGFAAVDIEANKVGATAAAVNFLIANPKATVEQAIAEGRKYMESKAQSPGENFISVGGNYGSPGGSGVSPSSGGEPKGGYASGGYISGAGGPKADLIPARLSNGEYVVQASSVDKYGVGMMEAINEQKFADGGLVLDPSTKSKINIAEKEWGENFNIVKGGYLKADKYSGSTHTGGGVFDAYYAGGSKLFPVAAVKALRKAGFAAWNRWQFGANNKHIHAIEIGNPKLSKSAASQVRAYLRGEDGLGGKDTLSNDYKIDSASTSVIPDEVAPNLDKIATAMGTTAEIYNQVKNDGIASLIGRRFGGSMTMNKPYMVGEDGPEIVMPYGSGGKVVPIKYNVPAMANGGIINGSMASSSPQINVTVNGVNDPKQAADRAAQLINSEMNRRKFSRSIG